LKLACYQYIGIGKSQIHQLLIDMFEQYQLVAQTGTRNFTPSATAHAIRKNVSTAIAKSMTVLVDTMAYACNAAHTEMEIRVVLCNE
jgi:hypothetical protein